MQRPLLNVTTASKTSRLAFVSPLSVAVGSGHCLTSSNSCDFRALQNKLSLQQNTRLRLPVVCLAAKKKRGASGGESNRVKNQKRKSSPTPASSATPNDDSTPPPLSATAKSEEMGDEQAVNPAHEFLNAGPIAPELLMSSASSSVPSLTTDTTPTPEAMQFISENSTPVESIDDDDDFDEKQVLLDDDSKDKDTRLKLPDLNNKAAQSSSSPKIKRKRDRDRSRQQKQQEKQKQGGSGQQEQELDMKYSLDSVRKLAKAYRLGDESDETRRKLIDEIEKEPDFILKASASASDYDLTSAIFGTGKPNKQGIYILPYLQSAHIVLLAIALLVSFIYYPGFPLTEASDDVRTTFKVTLVIVFLINAVLASLAGKSAVKRNQPPLFWTLKTFLLGELAYGELRRNTKIVSDDKDNKKDKKKKQKQ